MIAQDPRTHGSVFVSLVSGSDKTTVSVATGQTDYYPLYGSLGCLTNTMRRSHKDSVLPIAFLSIPKCTWEWLLGPFVSLTAFFDVAGRKYDRDPAFRRFRKQLFHSSITAIYQTLKPGMTTPVVMRCPDGHYRRIIFGIGPYIADYPEQVLLACIVQDWCPKLVFTIICLSLHPNYV